MTDLQTPKDMIISYILAELKIVFNDLRRKVNCCVQLNVYTSYINCVFETFVIN